MLLRFAGFELDQACFELRGRDGGVIKLRRKTLGALNLLIANAGRIVGKQELMDAVWPNVHVGDDSLFQCIREVRTALGDDQRQLIELVSGQGYRFTAELSIASATASAQVSPARAGALFGRSPPTLAVMPIAATDHEAMTMAANVTTSLADGLAKIEHIRVSAPSMAQASGAPQAAFVAHGELRKGEQSWDVRARMVRPATGEIVWTASVSVVMEGVAATLQRSRLAAGIGHPLARRISQLLNADAHPVPAGRGLPSPIANVVVEQATAFIRQITRERFEAAQTMLKRALADDPDNIDLAVSLVALQLRGIQMVWYGPADEAAARSSAQSILERALRAEPNSIPVLEAHCRFLSATNQFVECLVSCARILSLDPWDGQALYLMGLAQLQLGRFDDALETFKQADRFDTPETSRWTWPLGAGWVSLLMRRNEEAAQWLQRSIAITPASGRTHMLLAVAYERLGLHDEAKAAMAQGLALRPNSTTANVDLPIENASPAFLTENRRIKATMVEIGLPERRVR